MTSSVADLLAGFRTSLEEEAADAREVARRLRETDFQEAATGPRVRELEGNLEAYADRVLGIVNGIEEMDAPARPALLRGWDDARAARHASWEAIATAVQSLGAALEGAQQARAIDRMRLAEALRPVARDAGEMARLSARALEVEQALGAQLAQARAALAQAEGTLAQNAARLGELEAELAGARNEIAALQAAAQDAAARLASLEATTRDKEARIALLEADAKEKAARIAALDADASDKAARLAKTQDDLERTGQFLARTEDDLAKTGQHLARTEEDLARTGQDLAKTGQHLAQTEQDLERTRQHLGKTEGDLETARAELRAREAALAAARADVMRLQSVLASDSHRFVSAVGDRLGRHPRIAAALSKLARFARRLVDRSDR
jgi:chromosome segregation ATPase